MQIAADILSITVTALKSLTLYRALCQEDINLDYVQNCLRDPNININWCDFKGWSVLMTAAYCGFDSVCDILLAQPNLDVNSALPDGLTALYIALLMRRTKIVESLTRHKNINTKAIWKQRAWFGVPEIDKLGRVEWTPGDVARAMGLEDCVSLLE
jgi:ankyrin repeat protein